MVLPPSVSMRSLATGKAFTSSYAAQFTYKDSTGRQEVNAGFLPAGFLAIDLAHALDMPLFDPDSQIKDSTGQAVYEPVDPKIPQQTATTRQHPNSGNGLIGGSGHILNQTDAKVVVAANGGSDLIYVPDQPAARAADRRIPQPAGLYRRNLRSKTATGSSPAPFRSVPLI